MSVFSSNSALSRLRFNSLLQWYGHPRVLGIPIPKTPVIGASPSHITLHFWYGYWRRSILSSIHLLANLFDASPVTIPEAFSKVNSVQSSSQLWTRDDFLDAWSLELENNTSPTMPVQFYIKLFGLNVFYSKFRRHDVLKGTCLSYVGDGYATGRKEEEDSKTLVCGKSCTAISCMLCRYLHLTLM